MTAICNVCGYTATDGHGARLTLNDRMRLHEDLHTRNKEELPVWTLTTRHVEPKESV